MKILFLLTFTLYYSFAFAQQVQNVKAIQQDDAIIQITYDLNDAAGKPYYVKLLMSKDGGKTFGDELVYVKGDVKNTAAGVSKKIIWEAKKEISYYEGNAIFRVEATPKKAALPDPIETSCGKIELLNVKAVGTKLIIEFNVITAANQKTSIGWSQSQTNLIDTNGNEFAATSGRLGDVQLNQDKMLLAGIPVKSQLIFDNIKQNVTNAAELQIYLWSNDCPNSREENAYVFNNVPIVR